MVLIGEQARYRARLTGGGTVVSWAVGGGSVSQAPDPAHPDELLLTADQPGNLTIIVRVRKGLADAGPPRRSPPRRASPPRHRRSRCACSCRGGRWSSSRSWSSGFTGALVALGSFSSSEFIAVAIPLLALLGMAAVVRGAGDTPGQPQAGAARRPASTPRTRGTACRTTPTPRRAPG